MVYIRVRVPHSNDTLRRSAHSTGYLVTSAFEIEKQHLAMGDFGRHDVYMDAVVNDDAHTIESASISVRGVYTQNDSFVPGPNEAEDIYGQRRMVGAGMGNLGESSRTLQPPLFPEPESNLRLPMNF